MANSGKSINSVRRFLLVLVATAASVSGLALLAGGGYMLFAGELPPGSTEPIRMVAAEEVTSPTPSLSITFVPVGTTSALATAQNQAAASPQPTATPIAIAEAPTPTPTRVAKATNTPVPVVTALPGGSELPDTGFGEFAQPLIGVAFAATALSARFLRRRRG